MDVAVRIIKTFFITVGICILMLFSLREILSWGSGVTVEVKNKSGKDITKVSLALEGGPQSFSDIPNGGTEKKKLEPMGEGATFDVSYFQDGKLRTAKVDIYFQSEKNMKFVVIECGEQGKIEIYERGFQRDVFPTDNEPK